VPIVASKPIVQTALRSLALRQALVTACLGTVAGMAGTIQLRLASIIGHRGSNFFTKSRLAMRITVAISITVMAGAKNASW
jgi:hypothetical protein